jgi:hypothetical protein
MSGGDVQGVHAADCRPTGLAEGFTEDKIQMPSGQTAPAAHFAVDFFARQQLLAALLDLLAQARELAA